MAPNYTLGVWKAPAAPASILHPSRRPLPSWAVRARRPTSTLTPLPGVANSSQAVGTISGRCQESKMMNYEYTGDVDWIAVLGERRVLLCPPLFFLSGTVSRHPNMQTDSGRVSALPVWDDGFPLVVTNGCFREGNSAFGLWLSVTEAKRWLPLSSGGHLWVLVSRLWES